MNPNDPTQGMRYLRNHVLTQDKFVQVLTNLFLNMASHLEPEQTRQKKEEVPDHFISKDQFCKETNLAWGTVWDHISKNGKKHDKSLTMIKLGEGHKALRFVNKMEVLSYLATNAKTNHMRLKADRVLEVQRQLEQLESMKKQIQELRNEG